MTTDSCWFNVTETHCSRHAIYYGYVLLFSPTLYMEPYHSIHRWSTGPTIAKRKKFFLKKERKEKKHKQSQGSDGKSGLFLVKDTYHFTCK